MNPIAAQQALKVASSLWGQFNKYRKEKAAEAYSALEDAASTVKDNACSFSEDVESRFPEARKQAGAVTKAAHDRVERALAEFNSRGEEASERLVSAASDFSDRAEKATRSTRKKARKQAAQATKAAQSKRTQLEKTANKKLGKKKSKSKAKSFFSIAGIIALIAAALGGVYYWLRRNDTPGEVPPRVEDFADKPGTPDTSGSTLVYTSTTEDDQKDKAGVKVGSAGDLAEDGAEERDEELLNSLEEQLAAHREQAEQAETEAASNTNDVDATEPVADSDAPEADAEADKAQEASDDAAGADDTARVTDDSEDEGKHRLEGDEK